MDTRKISVDPHDPDSFKIREAADVIKRGGLVAFPTETVYGLGANGLDENAVKKIFEAKGRPQDNPLILHVSDTKQLNLLAEDIPDRAHELMDVFWPGPLTLIMKRSAFVPDAITGGLDTVAIRMPKNIIALELISACGCPLAAPSANISGRPSPTCAKHVMDDLDGRIDMVIDGGSVDIGIESTVVDLTQGVVQILRPGKITRKKLERIVGKIEVNTDSKKPRAPGMKYKHYAPEANIVIIENKKELASVFEKFPKEKIQVLEYKDEIQMARSLFRDFRESDKQGYKVIAVWKVKEEEFGCAIMDRLRKASGKKN